MNVRLTVNLLACAIVITCAAACMPAATVGVSPRPTVQAPPDELSQPTAEPPEPDPGAPQDGPPAPSGASESVAELPVLNPDALRSYLAKTEVRIDALIPEEAMQAWTIMEMRADKDATTPITEITVFDKTLSEDGEETRAILAGDEVFIRAPADEKWLRLAHSDSTMILPGMIGPDDLAALVADSLASAAVVAPDEEISGIPTTHYQLSGDGLAAVAARALPGSGRLVSGQLDLWVAREGYVKQVIQELVIEDAASAQTRHLLTLSVLEDNQPQGIAIPAASEVVEITLPESPTLEPTQDGLTPTSP
jgi:hypothetical protein